MLPNPHRISTADLRRRCEPSELPFTTTTEVEPLHPVTGHEDAVDALRFGLATRAPGHNIYVRGLVGTGRERMVRRILEEISPSCPQGADLCYVHDFRRPMQPRLVKVPHGRGNEFRDIVADFASFIAGELSQKLNSDALQEQRQVLDTNLASTLNEIGGPFEAEIEKAELKLVSVQVRGENQAAIVPFIDGKAAGPEDLVKLRESGRLDAAKIAELAKLVAEYGKRFEDISRKMLEARDQHRQALAALFQDEAKRLLRFRVAEIETRFPIEPVRIFLAEVIDDVIRRRLGHESDEDSWRTYEVNVLVHHEPDAGCPIIIENTPSIENLLGSIQPRVTSQGLARADHLMIRAGSLVEANGGFLVLEARDLMSEAGAWKSLMRCLRTTRVEIGQQASPHGTPRSLMKPEPIEIDAKVILIGDPGLYGALDSADQDFPHQFKILSDFQSHIPRDEQGVRRYAGALSRLTREEQLPDFEHSAVAMLVEHGSRVAGRQDRLSLRFGRLTDIAREGAYISRQDGRELVVAADITEAIRRGRRRADLPARSFHSNIHRGIINVQSTGAVVGQINGLAVVHAGPLAYGFPSRITATIGAGSAGAINIERESQLSGAIHTKGFYILGGLLRHLLKTPHPHAFSASIAFEQSYGGIDGDSASGAEMCCLLSALTDTPIQQNFAMTGAIDQHGRIQAIGAANEKIEGFFDICSEAGLTGDQGVLIPKANVGDLMLRHDVVEACENGQFHVLGIDSIQQALEILTGVEAGERSEDGTYPAGSLLAKAVEQATCYWEQASHSKA
ncbi:MAG: putative ATP-dependent protease [Planctomycetota bacterium]|jgi:predicted ATP-dependent protease